MSSRRGRREAVERGISLSHDEPRAVRLAVNPRVLLFTATTGS
jgi:hypothetical protein